jgi:hypothetical protein
MRKKIKRNPQLIAPKQENEITMFGNSIQNCELGNSPEISFNRRKYGKKNNKVNDSDSDD